MRTSAALSLFAVMADAVLRPSEEEMRDRVEINLHGKTCPECGKSFKSRQTYMIHMAIKHQNMPLKEVMGSSDAGSAATTPAICPACDQQCSTMAVLLKHYMRKHVEAADITQFSCPKCGRAHKTKSDLKEHEPFCLRGADEGKVIRCLVCQFLAANMHTWANHQKITKHRSFDLCWPDGSSGDAPRPPTMSAVPAAFGVVLDDEEVRRADGLSAHADPASEDEAVVVHVGQLEVHNAYTREASARTSARKLPRHG